MSPAAIGLAITFLSINLLPKFKCYQLGSCHYYAHYYAET
jgi:magnesium chelatase family protein